MYLDLSLAVCLVMAADVASGSARAIADGEFRSREMRRGFWRKAAEMAALFGLIGAEHVAVASGVDLAAPFGFIGGAGYIATMETASIVENLRLIFGDSDHELEEGNSNGTSES